jgi:hypothetical protein
VWRAVLHSNGKIPGIHGVWSPSGWLCCAARLLPSPDLSFRGAPERPYPPTYLPNYLPTYLDILRPGPGNPACMPPSDAYSFLARKTRLFFATVLIRFPAVEYIIKAGGWARWVG